MSAIDELRRRVAEQEETEARKWADRQEELVAEFEARAVNALGAELLGELKAEFAWSDHTGGGPYMSLFYRGQKYTTGRMPGADSLVAWMEKTDDDLVRYEQRRANVRAEWLVKLSPLHPDNMRLYAAGVDYARKTLADYELLDDPELQVALAGYTERVEAFLAANEQERAEREAEKERQQAKAREDLFRIANTAMTWGDLSPVTQVMEDSYGYPGPMSDDDELMAAWTDANERISIAMQKRETRRRQAQDEAFQSFQFYRVTYAIVATLDGESYVETKTFDSLRPDPNPDTGFWMAMDRKWPLCVPNVVSVEEITVTQPDDMPGWCQRVETEWGQIKVPPGYDGDVASSKNLPIDDDLPW